MTDTLREQLQATLGAAYRIDRELAGGGMARVFVARDAALDREVVVKVISPELAEGVDAKRFTREIKLAAKLQQANIVPVINAGETGGLPYYTMPFVDGLSLRARMATAGPMAFAEVASVLRDVSRALAYAHARGIVHRDMKPDNVLLSGGTAMVTDFGLGKALLKSRERGATGDKLMLPNISTSDVTGTHTLDALTQLGMTVGTPAYMSPEQATADPKSDHRSDIYSLGVMAYEMITGGNPFLAKMGQRETLQAQVSEMPAPVEKYRPDCPPALADLVMRCLAKKPADRPQTAEDLIHGLDALALSSPSQTRVPPAARSRRRWVLAAVAAVIFLSGVAAALLVRQTSRPATPAAQSDRLVAVLPFENIGGDTADAYFADGMADELTTALSKVPGLRVVSRTSAFAMRGRKDLDAKQIGKRLNVAAVLEGSVRRADNRMRISVQLTNTDDGLVLWSEGYQSDPKDVFAVQDEITKSIVNALRGRLTRGDSTSAAPAGTEPSQGTRSVAAYDRYLRGLYAMGKRGSAIQTAVQHFNEAIAEDSTFARAYAGLSSAYYLMPYYTPTPTRDVIGPATAAAQRAVALGERSSEAHAALAMSYQLSYDWTRSEAEFRRALALDPDNGQARYQLGRQLCLTGKISECLAELERAKVADPLSAILSTWVSRARSLAGHHDEAIAEARRARELDPALSPAQTFAALALLAGGKRNDARQVASSAQRVPISVGLIAHVLAATGDRTGATAIIRELEEGRGHTWFAETNLAYAYLGMADTTRALEALERAVARDENFPVVISLSDQVFDPLRGKPAFAAIVKRYGLDERIATDPKGGRP